MTLSEEGAEKVTMIVNSGDYDRVSYALSIAKIAGALGMEVHMLFTYGGLTRLLKSNIDDLGGIADSFILERLRVGLAKGTIAKLTDNISEAKRLGLKIYACINAMHTLDIVQEQLIDEVDQVMGLSKFINLSRGAMTYYI